MKSILRQFLQREAHPVIQFIKYGMAGGFATVVDVLVFYLLSLYVFYALTPDDRLVVLLNLDITPVSELTRSRHFIWNRAITFMFSNLAAYVANVLWVFEPGRHKRSTEITLFYVISAISFFLGTFLGWALIKAMGTTTTAAYVANMVCSVTINYVCRKYVIFKR